MSECGTERILRMPEGPKRTAAIAAWFQGLYGPESAKPILVGGAAVELYTRGAYTTGDLDFVGNVPSHVARALEEAGFRREGRHWIHERGQIFIELPGSSLDPGDKPSTIQIEGFRVVTSSPEGLIVDRLAAWQFWNVRRDAANGYLIWKAREKQIDTKLLETLARNRRVSKALRSLQAFLQELGDREASPDELKRWSSALP